MRAELTYWEKLVWIEFNPSNDDRVYKIKAQYAEIINTLNDLRKAERSNPEFQRYISIAITEAQTAQMRSVKAITA